MTPEQTAQQLELAAQLIRTGHPWEWETLDGTWFKPEQNQKPEIEICTGHKIRPVLATPPDNRPLHNPGNLTAEQVGVGYRLTVKGEPPHEDAERWERAHQTWGNRLLSTKSPYAAPDTYRLPLSVPWPEPEKPDPYAELKAAHAAGKVIQYRSLYCPEWQDQRSISWNPPDAPYKPEYRIKPEPAFQLPPPPPGMRWHREDGWTADDLPQGYRPLVVGEKYVSGDEYRTKYSKNWHPETFLGTHRGSMEVTQSEISSFRTTRPLTFNHAGKTWTYHRPGDPMPCDGDRDVYCLVTKGDNRETNPTKSRYMGWSVADDKLHFWGVIIGWRYADETKTVPFDISDVPPCSVLSLHPPRWFDIYGVCKEGIYVLDDEPLVETLWKWNYLAEKVKINRSIPLTGKWNPNSWEPCHKTISQNG